MIVMLGVSVLISAFPEITQKQVLRTFVGLGVYCAFAAIPERIVPRESATWLLRWIAVLIGSGAVALSIAAPFIVQWQSDKFSGLIPGTTYGLFPQLVSDTVNPNVMAGALALLISLAATALLLQAKKSRHWVIGWIVLSYVLAVLVLTQSRGAWLGAAAGLLTIGVLRSQWVRLAAVIITVGGTLVAIFQPSVVPFVFGQLGHGGAMIGSAGRQEIWTHASYIIQDFLFTGVGMGSFAKVNMLFYPNVIAEPGVPHAHNLILQIAVDLGIPGLIAWLGILWHVLRSAWRAYRLPDPVLSAIGAGVLASQCAMLTHGMVDAAVWGMMRTAPLVWAVWGLAAMLNGFEESGAASATQTVHLPTNTAAIDAPAPGSA